MTTNDDMTIAEQIAEAHGHIARAHQRRADAKADTANAEWLESPACAEGCVNCIRACAVASITLGWWERELTRLDPVSTATIH